MKCVNCGAEIADDSRFCPECGSKIEQAAEQAAEKVEQAAEQATAQAEQAAEQATAQAEQVAEQAAEQTAIQFNAVAKEAVKPAKKSHKGLIIGLICGGVALLAAIIGIVLFIVLSGGGTEDVDLSKYFKVTFEGADGYGEATVDFDETKLYKDMCEASKKFDKIYSGSGNVSDKARSNYRKMKDIDYYLDKDSELSNGDKVKLKVEFDNEAANDLGINFVLSKSEYTAADLTAVKEVDPFEGVTVTFEGTSPSVYADIEKPDTEEYYDVLYFSTKGDDYYFAKGDTVTVVAETYYDEAYIAKNYGVKFTQTEKDYVVENVDAYIESMDEIKDTALDAMKTATETAVTSYFDYYDTYLTSSDMKYEGLYFLKATDEESWNPNKTYIVYSATVASKDKEFKKQTVYFTICFEDILLKADGSQTIETNLDYIDRYDIKGETDIEFDDGWYRVIGYKTLDDLKSDLIDSETDYTSTATAGL